jgi:CBS domain-containing protein
MNIASICQRRVITIEADASLKEAAAFMRENHVGALVVIDAVEPSRVAGVVTDRDLAIEVLAGDVDAAGMCVGQLVNGSLFAVPGSGSVQDAVTAMEEAGVRRLLVTDDEGRVIGFLSSGDLLDAIAAELGGLARALRSGIARENAERPPFSLPEHPVFLPQGMPGMR